MDDRATQIDWDEYGTGHLTLTVPLFGQDVVFELLMNAGPPVVSPKMWQAVDHVLALPETDRAKLADLLWEEAHFSLSVADYGVEVRAGETHLQAHLRDFGIVDQQDTLTRAKVRAVQLSTESDRFSATYATIQMETVTDNYISVIVRDGVIVDYAEDGCDLGGYDQNPQEAHENRMKVLGDEWPL